MATQDGGMEASLRVLYTINTSPQYILAKSLDKHKVTLVKYGAANGSSNLPSYGRVALKPCVTAICRSSPEVQPSGMRDYSLYVLDPLEDIMSRNARGSSDGVAVGMGLLSSILSSQESDAAMVTGTFIQCAADEVALEVVISLRQIVTQPMEHPSYHNPQQFYGSGDAPFYPHEAYMRSMGMYDPNNPMNHMMYPSYAAVAPAKQAAKSKATAILDNTRAAQFPTPYIGPPKRAPGRPSRKKQGGSATPVPQQTPTPTPTTLPSETPSSSQPERTETCESTTADKDIPMSEAESSDRASPAVAQMDSSPSATSMGDLLAAIKKMADASPDGIPESEQNNTALKELLSYLQSATKSDQQTLPAIADPSAYADKLQQQAGTQATAVIEAVKETPSPMEQSVGNKENIKPRQLPTASSTPLSLEEKRRLLGASSSSGPRRPSGSLMSSSSPRRVSSSSSSSRSSVKRAYAHASRDRDASADAVENLRNIKKRRVEQQSKNSQRGTSTIASASKTHATSPAKLIAPAAVSSTPALAPAPASTPLQSNHGLHVNSGWGGLRMRADGSFSGGHPLRPAATIVQASTSSSKVVSFFRSAPTNTSVSADAAPVRKGPYKIPQWAKGVPPPSPPAWAKEKEKEEKEGGGKEAKRRKRVGTGKRESKAEVQKQKEDVQMVTSDPVQAEEAEHCEQIASTPTQQAPAAPFIAHSDAPPIIAHSSPIARPRRSNNLPLFATSPCRPSTSASRIAAEPQTPGPNGSLFGTPPSNKSLRNVNDSMSSLFTPSPNIKTPSATGILAANVQVRLAGPSSPCPTSRKRITVSSTAEFGRPLPPPLLIKTKSMTVDDDLEMYPEDSDGPASSLPIASSDDDSMANGDEDVTMKLSFGAAKKDWVSLGLPPSSPLPASSPLLSSADELPDVDEPSGSQSQNDADVSEEDGDGGCSEAGSSLANGQAGDNGSLLGLFNMTSEEQIGAAILALDAGKDDLDLQLQQELMWSSSSDINVDLSQFEWEELMQNTVTDGLQGVDITVNADANVLSCATTMPIVGTDSSTASFGSLDASMTSFFSPLAFDDLFSTGM